MFPLLIKSRKLSFCSEFWLLVSVQSSGSGSWLWLLSFSAVFDRSRRLMEWLIEVVVAALIHSKLGPSPLTVLMSPTPWVAINITIHHVDVLIRGKGRGSWKWKRKVIGPGEKFTWKWKWHNGSWIWLVGYI